MQLQRATGLDAETASHWVEVLKLRNISVDQFQTSLNRLSKQMDKVRTTQADLAAQSERYADAAARLDPIIRGGGEAGKEAQKELNLYGKALASAQKKADAAATPFQQLGVNLKTVASGDIQKTLLQMADGFAKIENPAQRAALAQATLGRTGTKLGAILYKGSGAIEDQLAMVAKYGNTITKDGTDKVAEMTAQQRELQAAQDGLKTQLGVALIPVMLQLSTALLDVVHVLHPLLANGTAMKVLIVALAAAFVAYKVAVIASTIASLGLNAAMLPTIGLVLAIVAAIAALVAIGILLYRNWDKIKATLVAAFNAIKAAAVSAFSWIKTNWPLLLAILVGPFGVAVYQIVKNWDAIVEAVSGALDAISEAIGGMLDDVAAILDVGASGPAKLVDNAAGIAKGILDAIVGGLKRLA